MKTRIGIAVLATFLLVPAVPVSAINIYSGDIVDGEVKTVDLDSNAVTSAKILNGEVKTADLGVDAVTTNKILNGTIGTDDLANGAVTDAKISGQISSSKIMKAGLDADTLDGIDSTGFAPASHAHAQSDVTGLAAALAGKADVSHDHDAVYQRKYGKIAVVAKAGGDYSSPIDALANASAWCGVPSADNPCLVKLMPGVYDLGTDVVFMQNYIDLEGSGMSSTRLVSSVSDWGQTGVVTFSFVDNSELRSLTVRNVNATNPAHTTGIRIIECSPRIVDVSVQILGAPPAWVVGINSYRVNNRLRPTLSRVTIQATGLDAYGIWSNQDVANYENLSIQSTSTGGWGVGIYSGSPNFPGEIVVSNSSISATRGTSGEAVGVLTGNGSTVVSNSMITGTNAGMTCQSWGGATSSVAVHHSTLAGSTSAVADGVDSILKIAASELIGPVSGNGTLRCVGNYDSDYNQVTCP